MAEMKWQGKINLDKLDEGTQDYLLELLMENRELRKTAEKERESRLSWYKRCEELEDRISCIGKKGAEYMDAFPNEYKKEKEE